MGISVRKPEPKCEMSFTKKECLDLLLILKDAEELTTSDGQEKLIERIKEECTEHLLKKVQ